MRPARGLRSSTAGTSNPEVCPKNQGVGISCLTMAATGMACTLAKLGSTLCTEGATFVRTVPCTGWDRHSSRVCFSNPLNSSVIALGVVLYQLMQPLRFPFVNSSAARSPRPFTAESAQTGGAQDLGGDTCAAIIFPKYGYSTHH
jgi:hypothetical protein